MSHQPRAVNPAKGASRNSRKGTHRRKRSYDFSTPLRRTTKGKISGCIACMPGFVGKGALDKAQLRRLEHDAAHGLPNYFL